VSGPDNQNEESVSDDNQQPEAEPNTPDEGVKQDGAEEPKPEPKRRGRKPKTPEPDMGRMVRYVTASETVRPAVISRVNEDGSVDLTVFNSLGAQPVTNVEHCEFDPEVVLANTYHWPEFN